MLIVNLQLFASFSQLVCAACEGATVVFVRFRVEVALNSGLSVFWLVKSQDFLIMYDQLIPSVVYFGRCYRYHCVNLCPG